MANTSERPGRARPVIPAAAITHWSRGAPVADSRPDRARPRPQPCDLRDRQPRCPRRRGRVPGQDVPAQAPPAPVATARISTTSAPPTANRAVPRRAQRHRRRARDGRGDGGQAVPGRYGIRANTVCPGLVIPEPDSIGAGSLWNADIGFGDKQITDIEKATPAAPRRSTSATPSPGWLPISPACSPAGAQRFRRL
jgi:hypothetical protein